jgi:3' terminal RNA ribose 2'-O-methyltransferase Hen1
MLLTIRTTHRPAGDLGYLLHKNPARTQSFELSFGGAHVFYPELSDEATTAALLLDVDPVGLVRNRRGPSGEGGALEQYVNDRPYVASSFLSVAIAQVLRSAMAGTSKERPELAATPIPLEATLAVLPCRGGEAFLRRLFEPLGYTLDATPHALSPDQPEWGMSRYYTVRLGATCRLAELLTHLYVLVPVLDDGKHYWVGDEEVEKLLRHGAGWLERHPERDLITRRYLRHQRSLVDEAIRRLTADIEPEDDTAIIERDAEEADLERPLSLHERRLELVAATLKAHGAKRVIDLGCGEGKLLRLLLQDRQFEAIVGMDVAWRSLEIASERLNLERMPPKQRERITLLHGSLMYRDTRLEGFDAAAVVEVIEHLDPPRLAAFERTLFEFARPGMAVITTPNAEYNAHWPSLPAGRFRHKDHRFEWTRQEFRTWGETVTQRFGYQVEFRPVGDEDPALGPPSQMGVFTR